VALVGIREFSQGPVHDETMQGPLEEGGTDSGDKKSDCQPLKK